MKMMTGLLIIYFMISCHCLIYIIMAGAFAPALFLFVKVPDSANIKLHFLCFERFIYSLIKCSLFSFYEQFDANGRDTALPNGKSFISVLIKLIT
jgi:hypothetical protein